MQGDTYIIKWTHFRRYPSFFIEFIIHLIFLDIYPSEFYKKFLSQGVRPDGRTLLKIRKTTVSTGTQSFLSTSIFTTLK